MFIPVTWTGISGKVYQFEVDPLGSVYNDRPGVYIFCKLEGRHFKALYIGETRSFRQRLWTDLVRHHQWDSVRAAGATHIGTLHVPVGDLAAREGIETDLRHAIPTPCNLQGRNAFSA